MTELRYICSKDMQGIVSVQESATCQYVVVFAVPLLCLHPDFRQQEVRLHFKYIVFLCCLHLL